MDITAMLDKYGWPGLVAFCLGLVIWRVGKWASAKADILFDRAVKHLDAVDAVVSRSAEREDRIAAAQTAIAKAHQESADASKTTAEAALAAVRNSEAILTVVRAFECKYAYAADCEHDKPPAGG